MRAGLGFLKVYDRGTPSANVPVVSDCILSTYESVLGLVALFLEIQIMRDGMFLPLFRMENNGHIELAPSFLFTHKWRRSES